MYSHLPFSNKGELDILTSNTPARETWVSGQTEVTANRSHHVLQAGLQRLGHSASTSPTPVTFSYQPLCARDYGVGQGLKALPVLASLSTTCVTSERVCNLSEPSFPLLGWIMLVLAHLPNSHEAENTQQM